MKTKNAIAKLEKIFGAVDVDKNGQYSVSHRGMILSFYNNGRLEEGSEICCINVRNENNHDDIQSDYSAGSFADNLTMAIRWLMTW